MVLQDEKTGADRKTVLKLDDGKRLVDCRGQVRKGLRVGLNACPLTFSGDVL